MNLKVMMMMVMMMITMDVVPHLRSCLREQNHGTHHCEVLVQIQVGGQHEIQRNTTLQRFTQLQAL